MNESRSSFDPTRQAICIVAALVLITLLVYLPTCFHDFILFDDPSYVSDNPVVQAGLTMGGLKWAFAGWHASNWHPLTWISHMADCELFGLHPGAHHFINSVFHAVNAALLFWFFWKATGALWPSAVVAALFAWHPLRVESVAWIAERKDVLSTFFGLLSLLFYSKYARQKRSHRDATVALRRHYILSVVFLGLGLLAKPMLVTLPFVFLLLDYWPLNRIRPTALTISHVKALALEKTPFFLLVSVSSIVTYLAQRADSVVSLQDHSITLRLANALVAYAKYVVKTVWPLDLAIIYPLPVRISAEEILLAGTFLAIISLIAWWTRLRMPCLIVGWLWFLGTLVPVIGLVQVGHQAMADRYSYIPSVGLYVAVVFSVACAAAADRRAMIALRFATGLVLLGSIAITEHQLGYWQDTKTLFTHALSATSNNPKAHMILGVALEQTGDTDAALKQYAAALEMDDSLTVLVGAGRKRPLAAHASLLLAQVAEQQNDKAAAMAQYREALRISPALIEAHNNLANLLDESGNIQEALAHYETAVRLDTQAVTPRENLGSFLLKQGRFEDAINHFEKAAQIQPDDSRPIFLTGKAWLRRGQSTLAIAHFRQALDLNPNDPQALTCLARILASDQRDENRNGTEALALALKANELTGRGNPSVLDTLAMAFAETGRFKEAQTTIRRAIESAIGDQPTELSAMQQRELRFMAGQPWREPFTNTLPTHTPLLQP